MPISFPLMDSKGQPIVDRDEYVRRAKHGEVLKGKVLKSAKSPDLALIELDKLPPNARAVKIAARSPRPGQTVHSCGNPGASDAVFLYTQGVVRQVSKKNWISGGAGGMTADDAQVIETQSPTNPGDSGGPLVDDRLELVGVTQGGNTEGELRQLFRGHYRGPQVPARRRRAARRDHRRRHGRQLGQQRRDRAGGGHAGQPRQEAARPRPAGGAGGGHEARRSRQGGPRCHPRAAQAHQGRGRIRPHGGAHRPRQDGPARQGARAHAHHRAEAGRSDGTRLRGRRPATIGDGEPARGRAARADADRCRRDGAHRRGTGAGGHRPGQSVGAARGGAGRQGRRRPQRRPRAPSPSWSRSRRTTCRCSSPR